MGAYFQPRHDQKKDAQYVQAKNSKISKPSAYWMTEQNTKA